MRMRSIPNTMKALALSSVALVAGAWGCSSDDYYCDANGCYYCDGVGCRAVTPPSRPTCSGDYQCTANQVCTDVGCTASCSSDTDCAQGWVCRGASGTTRGICVAPTERTPTRNPGACRTNADCSGGALCVDGACSRPVCTSVSSSCPCSTNEQCTSGQTCIGGLCTAPADTCRFNSQCGTGRVCVNQQCRAACSATTPCPAGQRCGADGVCANAPSNECVHDADCGTGRRCVNASCLTRCSTNTECGAGRFCNDGVCVADTRRQPFCTNDSQCAAPSRCLDGVCRRPCASADECLRTDVQYRNCAPVRYLGTSQSFCQTNNEVLSDCGSATECAAAQACVDGVCRSN